MINKLNSILFTILVFGVGIGFFALPKKKISMEEKRKLAIIPQFSWNTYTNGSWSDSIDAYVDDHFPYRDEMIESADYMVALKGITKDEGEKIVVGKKPRKTKNPAIDIQSTSDPEIQMLTEYEEEYSGDLLILDGKVYNLTGGSTKMSPVFAKMVNWYAAELNGECRVFSAVAPVACAFIPVEKYRRYNKQNKATLDAIGANLQNGAIYTNIFAELNAHANRQLYFGTDHHWNAYGAYYAYVAYCKSAGLTPVPLEKMQHKVKYGFLGSMYQHTRDKSVKEHPDTFDIFIPPVTTTAVRYPEYGFNNAMKVSVFANSNGGNMYSTFISGDHPLIKITTSTKNGRKCAVVKNSMGNAFSVYLISHYEEIYVVDFRYSKHNLVSLIRENHINDLVFAVGLYAAMSNGTIGMMRRLATNAGVAPPKPKQVDSLKPESASPTADTLKEQ